MANIRVSLPEVNATATYAYRDTGGSWSIESTLDKGFGTPDENFSMVDPCDEFRVTVTYSVETDFDWAFISTMNITSGLTFSIQTDLDTPIVYSQDTETSPRQRQSQLHRLSSTTQATTIVFIVTGIGQNIFSFGQVCFGASSFVPTMNIQNESSLSTAKQYKVERTAMGFVQRLDQSAREYLCQFLSISNAEYDALEKMIDVDSVNGFILFELDGAETRLDNAFLCYCSIQKGKPLNNEKVGAEMTIYERFGRD